VAGTVDRLWPNGDKISMILENKIDIQANPKLVWQVTIDVESWPIWSPAMKKIIRMDSNEFKPGSAALIKQKLLPETLWVVTELTPNSSFSWHAKVFGIEMIATHILIPIDSGVTSVLKLEMLGWMTKLFGSVIKKPPSKALREENWGLKTFCESLESAPPPTFKSGLKELKS
jgi:hypothetical protein